MIPVRPGREVAFEPLLDELLPFCPGWEMPQIMETAIIEYVRTGTETEKVGATMAWYFARPSLRYASREAFDRGEPTAESKAAQDALADLREQYRTACLAAFLACEAPMPAKTSRSASHSTPPPTPPPIPTTFNPPCSRHSRSSRQTQSAIAGYSQPSPLRPRQRAVETLRSDRAESQDRTLPVVQRSLHPLPRPSARPHRGLST
jgi:hypothetical protein